MDDHHDLGGGQEEQFQRIEHCFPTQRGNMKLFNRDALNTIPQVLYMTNDGASGEPSPSGLVGVTRSVRG